MQFAARKQRLDARHRVGGTVTEVHQLKVDRVELIGDRSGFSRAASPLCLDAPAGAGNALPTLLEQPGAVLRKFLDYGRRHHEGDVAASDQLLERANQRRCAGIAGQIQPDARIDEHPNRRPSARRLAHQRPIRWSVSKLPGPNAIEVTRRCLRRA